MTSSEVGFELARQYEFLSVIASGGMGTVYEARHLVLNQKVAIKMMQTERLDDKHVTRFRHEAEALAALEHSNIIHVRDYGLTENGQPYMVLDYVEGMSMSQMIQSRGPIPAMFALEFFAQIADALAHAHSRGVLHQDLKPNNIMICESGKMVPYAKLIDFGIAKIINGEATPSGLTNTGDILGSPAYMSPEQANGRSIDYRTDIYSLGCVMFEALTGVIPFKGSTALEIVAQHINTPAPKITDVTISEFPHGLAQLVARCLEKDPAARIQSMEELRDSLLDILVKAGAATTGSRPEQDKTKDGRHSQKKVVIVCCIGISLLILLTNGILLVKKYEAETARQLQVIKSDQTAAAAAQYDGNVIARQLIKEQIEKWRPGGEIKVDYENRDKDLEEFSHYPAVATFVSLENSNAKGPGLAYLIRYPLDFLSLNDASITDRAFLEIKHMKKLNQLQVDNVSLTDAAFSNLEDLPLERLSVRLNRIHDEALKNIARIRTLKHLQCGKNDQLTAKGYSELKSLPNLQNLDLLDNPIDVKAAKAIGQLKISSVNLTNTSINDEALKELCAMPYLHNICLGDCKSVSGAGMKYLANLPELDTVNLEGAKNITDRDVEFIKACPKLKTLDLRDTDVTDKAMEWIGNTNIKTLYLLRDNITDRGLTYLLKDKALRSVEVSSVHLSKEAIDNFNKLRPGVLRINNGERHKSFHETL
ncbi:MAG: protein kinase [Cyanobacteria bacterium SZAS-4]|nr:protein kinase [Cyanobacteria bacterium SZAS-4]